MNKHPIPSYLKCATIAVASFAALIGEGKAGVIFTDNFNGVAASSGQASAGLNGVGWFMYNNAEGGAAWTTATDTTLDPTGTVMSNPGGTSSNTVVYKQFATTAITNVGDSITISLDMRALGGAGAFNVSLLGTDQTLSTNTYSATAVLTNAAGYGFGLSATQDRPFLTAGTGNLWEVTNNDPIPYTNFLSDVSASTPITSAARTLTLTLTKTATGVQIASSYAGTTFSPYIDTAGSIHTSFNTVRIYGNNGGSGFNIDNVVVSTVPEPSTVAMVLLAGGVVLAWSRRRSGAEKASSL